VFRIEQGKKEFLLVLSKVLSLSQHYDGLMKEEGYLISPAILSHKTILCTRHSVTHVLRLKDMFLINPRKDY
jgi:hypothetical protein